MNIKSAQIVRVAPINAQKDGAPYDASGVTVSASPEYARDKRAPYEHQV